MKTLDKEHDKIQHICDTLRKETLEPAQREAEYIINTAKAHAHEIIHEAKQQAEKIQEDAKNSIERERNVFHSSLAQSTRQSLEALRQAIENKLFNPELHHLIVKHAADPKLIANIINAIVKAIEKDGTAADLIAYVSATASPEQINALLGEAILSRLKGHSVTLDEIEGGAKVRIENQKITLDISDREIEELLKRYVRKEFRQLLFAQEK